MNETTVQTLIIESFGSSYVISSVQQSVSNKDVHNSDETFSEREVLWSGVWTF